MNDTFQFRLKLNFSITRRSSVIVVWKLLLDVSLQ
ncbi:hypothetical protein T09_890 [Trichinella sp. T9]|nr:hypothetical protein T09_890 [Trichinella sp. T9]